MKFLIFLSQMCLYLSFSVFPQHRILVPHSTENIIESEYHSKIISSEVFALLNEKNYLKQSNQGVLNENVDNIILSIYSDEKPSYDKISTLENNGIFVFQETWIPPLENHPLGFMIAKVPLDKVNFLLSNDFIRKVGSAETQFEPNNNLGTTSIKANLVWNAGYTGTGVKVAILDSGLDTDPVNSDLPATIEKRDYSNFPTSVDSGVENTVSGHGTHVTGSVLGRGILSATNTGNGSGSYKGSAPNADLVFLKIGSDATSSASSAAMIASIQAAVDTFNADIISMSYGGWYDHHDGSSAEEQTVDWAYSQGIPVMMAAGNDGGRARHYSGTINANSESGFIQINVTGAGINNTALYFNLVWADSINRNNLSLKYYNSSQVELTSVTRYTTTESLRGTESHYSNYSFYVPSGSGTYYLKVVNPSNISQFFHIYDVWGARVTFQSPDPFYTVGQPSTADYCLSVGAHTSRINWTASNGSSFSYNGAGALNDIAPFSSRGPRIDGLIKPNITAPGSAIISMRDRDVVNASNNFWVDDDGTLCGNANYYVMQGTSMATPLVAGSVALILQKFPGVSPSEIYDAIQNNAVVDAITGSVPNNTWGYGKLDVQAASEEPLPVELSSFSASLIGATIKLGWQTATEVNNYGFEVERKVGSSQSTVGNYEKIGFVNGNGNSNSPKDYSFVDNKVSTGKYSYRLKQIDIDGQFEYSKTIEVDMNGASKYELTQNYPNPFNPTTTIRFNLSEAGNVKLTLFNILGQEIKILVNGIKEAGTHTINFDASELNSGMYIYKIEAGTFVQTRKMTLVK